ncbi:hypothetical protein GEMRC1_006847 [Eukaryota sp. GEM-RC1]
MPIIGEVLGHCHFRCLLKLRMVSRHLSDEVHGIFSNLEFIDFSLQKLSHLLVPNVLRLLPNLKSIELGLEPFSFFHSQQRSFSKPDCSYPYLANTPTKCQYYDTDLDISELYDVIKSVEADPHILNTLIGTPKKLLRDTVRYPVHSPSFACTRLFLNIPSTQHSLVLPLLELTPNVRELYLSGGVLKEASAFKSLLESISNVAITKLAFLEPIAAMNAYELKLLEDLRITSLQVACRDIVLEDSLLSHNLINGLFEVSLGNPSSRLVERLPRNVFKINISGVRDGIVKEFPRASQVFLGLSPDHTIKSLPAANWDTLVLASDPSEPCPLPFLSTLPSSLCHLTLADVEILDHSLFQITDSCPNLTFLALRPHLNHTSFLSGLIACLSSMTRLRVIDLSNCNLSQTVVRGHPYPSRELVRLSEIFLSKCTYAHGFLELVIPVTYGLLELEIRNCEETMLSGTLAQLLLNQPLVRFVGIEIKSGIGLDCNLFEEEMARQCESMFIAWNGW